MINKVIKVVLVSTSIAPILLTSWVVEQTNIYNYENTFFENVVFNWRFGIEYIISTIILVTICIVILETVKKRLEWLPIQISDIKPADKESISFILVYLLPLAKGVASNFNTPVLLFITILFFLLVINTNAYHFNPLLSFIGYHFYEVKANNGVHYILISRKSITSGKNIKSAYQLTDYIIIENNLES